MTMQSSNLLPALRELPGGDGERRSFRDHIAGLVNMDRAMSAAEFASAVSFGLWVVFDDVNVDDAINQAYERAFSGTLTEHWREMMERGHESMQGFMSPLKGKVAEIKAADILEEEGFTNVQIADDPTQPDWDISAIDPYGQEVFIQVKTGISDSQYYGTLESMRESDYPFMLGSELHQRISENAPELTNRILDDIGSDFDRVIGIEDGLVTLSDNMGIDIPDGVANIVPYAGAILASARLIHSIIRTEKEFETVDRTAKNKIQVVQTLTLMSRMGITTVLSTVGGMGGGALGSAVPGVGNLIGGIVGAAAGAGMGMYLNRHLQPHMLDLALDITGLTNDDLFYYKNKPRIDKAAHSFRKTAAALPPPS